MTLSSIKTLAQVEQRFRRDELERTEIATELRLLRERLNSSQVGLGGGAGISPAPHSALTLDATADVFLGLDVGLQVLGADQQGANEVFAGPTAAPDAFPDFRPLVFDDIPSTSNAITNPSTILAGDANGDITLRRLTLGDRLIHDGDPDNYVEFTDDQQVFVVGNEALLTLQETGQDLVLVGDGGDVDFVVQTTGVTQALFVEGSSGRVSINKGSPATELDVNGDITVAGRITHAGDTNTKIQFLPDLIEITAGDVLMLTMTEAIQDVVGIGDATGVGDVDITFSNNQMFLEGSTGHLGIGETGPDSQLVVRDDMFIGPNMASSNTSNGGMTIGLTINQEANDDQIFALASSDVAHGMTDFAETDVFGFIRKGSAAAGGLLFEGLRDAGAGANNALTLLASLGEAAITTKTAQGVISLIAQVKSGTGATSVGADGNLFSISNFSATRLIVDAEGTIHQIPGSDIDIDLLTVQVTGTPTLGWDESEDSFSLDKGLRVTSGFVGIGITSPATELDVNGDITVAGSIIHASDTDNKIAFTDDVQTYTVGGVVLLTLTEAAQDLITLGPGSGDVDVNFNGDMFLQGSNGFVGIGADAPVRLLHLKESVAGLVDLILMQNSSTDASARASLLFSINTDLRCRIEAGKDGANPGGSLRFYTRRSTLTEKMRIDGDGKVGIGTTDIPHGGIGVGMLAIDGPDNSSDGPHIQLTTVSDNYPLMQIHALTHDNVGIGFDAYWNGSAEASSDLGSNYTITKQDDLLKFSYASGTAQGSVPTFTIGFVLDTNGMIGVNTDTNTKMGIGLTIDQVAEDSEILALQSTGDVAHGMTDRTETETFGLFQKRGGGDGGLLIMGFSDATLGVQLWGNVVTDITTKTTVSSGAVEIRALKKSGQSSAAMGAGANLAVIRNYQTTRWILDAEGDIFYGGSDDGAITDEYDDVHLLSGFRAAMSPKKSPAYNRFKGFLQQTEDILVQQGVLTARLDEGGLVSDTALKGLIIDALIQITDRLNTLEEKHGSI